MCFLSNTLSKNVGCPSNETLRFLTAIQSGELCGSDWQPCQNVLHP